jgi:probable HAF family extracellular repeat protein
MTADGITPLGDLPGYDSTVAQAINNRGEVLVNASGPTGLRSFLFRAGQFVELSLPGDLQSVANGINNLGQVVGYSDYANGPRRAFLHTDGVTQEIRDLLHSARGRTLLIAHAINDRGQIVGQNDDAENHAYLLTPRKTAKSKPDLP